MTAAVEAPVAVVLRRSAVGVLRSGIHHPGGLPCVHLLDRPPLRLLFRRDALARLNFQPRVCTPPGPCIASRCGDILTLAFDSEGGVIDGGHHHQQPWLRYTYQLHQVRWSGSDTVDPDRVVGVLAG